MEKQIFCVTENRPIANDVYRLSLEGDASAIKKPGQFVSIALPSFYLRRPISVCDWSEKELVLIYKAVGEGTRYMTSLKPRDRLDLLIGLGNGFDTSAGGDEPLLVGGGVGTPPLYRLAKELAAAGKKPKAVLGFASEGDVFYSREFESLGVETLITTIDGSLGIKGFVTDAMKTLRYDSVFACGPLPMLRAVCLASDVPAQLSFEERMACGFGACMGCSRLTKNGAKRICKDGPVLTREEIIW